MANFDDLHAVLVARADEVSDALPNVDAAIHRAGRQRMARRGVVGLGAVSAVAAIGLPFALGLGGPVEDQAPRATSTTTAASGFDPEGGWVEDVPGLDLPVGDPLTTPYAVGAALHANDAAYSLPGSITRVIDAPEGIVVVSFDGPLPAPGSGSSPTSTISLLVDDRVTVDFQDIAAGYLGNVEAGRTESGATRLAWIRYQSDGDPENVELGTVVLGSGQPPTLLAATGLELVGIVDGEILVKEINVSPQAVSRWDLTTGTLVPVFELEFGLNLLAVGVGDDPSVGVFTRSRGDTQCVVAAPIAQTSVQTWEYCDEPYLVISPDHLLGTAGFELVDLRTGEVTVELGLGVPRSDWQRDRPPPPYIEVRAQGWVGGDVLVNVSYTTPEAVHTEDSGGDGTATYTTPVYVVVRCSTTTGACERIPHDVTVVATTP